MRKRLTILLATLALPAAADTACRYPDATAAARALFSDYHDFYARPRPELRHILTDRFLDVIARDIACPLGDRNCTPPADPWLNAASREIAGPPSYSKAGEEEDTATVRINYLLRGAHGTPHIREVLIYVVKPGKGNCWFVDDFLPSPSQSLTERVRAQSDARK